MGAKAPVRTSWVVASLQPSMGLGVATRLDWSLLGGVTASSVTGTIGQP